MSDSLQTTGSLESCISALREDVAFVLALDDVGPAYDQTNLFDMGMTSITAVELAARLRDHFGLPLQVRTLLEACTIDGLAKLIMASSQGQ